MEDRNKLNVLAGCLAPQGVRVEVLSWGYAILNEFSVLVLQKNSGYQFPSEACFQTGCGTHPASYPVSTGFFPRG
jgi:hypothetical protein